MVLEAANGNPLEAQRMEEELTPEWWAHWLDYRKQQAKAQEAEAKKWQSRT